MPSPIAHAAAGYVIYRGFRKPLLGWIPGGRGFLNRAVLTVVGVSLLPDIDVIPGLLLGDLYGIHNSVANSIVVGGLAAFMVGSVVWAFRRKGFRLWSGLVFTAYAIHVLMDYFTASRGVMALWPLSSRRFIAPVLLFYGLHYSEGLLSINHLWTVLSELGFAAAIVAGAHVLPRVIPGRRTAALR